MSVLWSALERRGNYTFEGRVEAIRAAEKGNDEASVDLLIQVIRGSMKTAWMLPTKLERTAAP